MIVEMFVQVIGRALSVSQLVVVESCLVEISLTYFKNQFERFCWIKTFKV